MRTIFYRALVFLFVSAGLVLPLAANAQSATEQTSVYPTVGAPGARFSFIAAGFKSRETVAVWINTPDGKIITEGIENLDRATRQGRVSWNWTAPEGAMLGTWQMVAHGKGSNTEKIITFEIKDETPPPPDNNIQPQSGIPGTLFTFYASGFLLDEDIRVWANTPEGKPVDIVLAQRRLYNGRFDGSWSAPTSVQRGKWQLVVQGVDSEMQQVLNFEIK